MPEFLGLSAPVLKSGQGFFETQRTRQVIRSDIGLILNTRLGSRPMLREFGSRLPELVFEQTDDVLKGLARNYVVDAIRRWERRIDVLDVQIEAEEHSFRVNLRYSIRTNSEEDLLVLTFARDL